MDFRKWQAEYSPALDNILVREGGIIAQEMWDYLVSQERIGYGVFKVHSDVGPEYAEWCDCPDPVSHTTGLCILR